MRIQRLNISLNILEAKVTSRGVCMYMDFHCLSLVVWEQDGADLY